MKIRTDFVTNSSSSMFTVTIDIYLKDNKRIMFWGHNYDDDDYIRYFPGTVEITVSPRQLGKARDVEELIKLLKEGVLSYPDSQYYIDCGLREYWYKTYFKPVTVLSDNTNFIKNIRRYISSMNDIDYIWIKGERSADDGDTTPFSIGYLYDMTKGEYLKECSDMGCLGHLNGNTDDENDKIIEEYVNREMKDCSHPGRIIVNDDEYLTSRDPDDLMKYHYKIFSHKYDMFGGYIEHDEFDGSKLIKRKHDYNDFVTIEIGSYNITLEIEFKNGEMMDLLLKCVEGGFDGLYMDCNMLRADILGGAKNIEEFISIIDKWIYWEIEDINADWNKEDEELWNHREEYYESNKYKFLPMSKPISRMFLEANPEYLNRSYYSECHVEKGKKFFEKLNKVEMDSIKTISIHQCKILFGPAKMWKHDQSYDMETGVFYYGEYNEYDWDNEYDSL